MFRNHEAQKHERARQRGQLLHLRAKARRAYAEYEAAVKAMQWATSGQDDPGG